MKIVLLGSIPKGDDIRKNWTDWKTEYKAEIRKVLPDAEFLHGDTISENAGAEMVVGHDLVQVKKADVCVVEARSKVGAGTAQEIVIAKQLMKPVVTVIPRDSHNRKFNIAFDGVIMKEWIHPFLKVSSDYVAESIEEAASWIKNYNKAPDDFAIKNISVFIDAIDFYEANEKQAQP